MQNGQLPAAGQYQAIPESETSLYLALPPQPDDDTILVDMPGDGTPPAFWDLLKAMSKALKNDPIDGAWPARRAGPLSRALDEIGDRATWQGDAAAGDGRNVEVPASQTRPRSGEALLTVQAVDVPARHDAVAALGRASRPNGR